MKQHTSGSIDDMSIVEARRARSSDQSRLSSFDGKTTYIAIVRSISDRMERVVDYADSRLSPPKKLFWQWYDTRESYMDDGTPKTVAHNRAFEDVRYEQRFRSYLEHNRDAQQAIKEIVDRMEDGENVVLVCYCTGDRACHRTIVREYVEDAWERRQ